MIPAGIDMRTKTTKVVVLNDGRVAHFAVNEKCAPCKPTVGKRSLPCVNACEASAIVHSW